jgi:hypothetical protein
MQIGRRELRQPGLIENWARENKMHFNENKSKILLVTMKTPNRNSNNNKEATPTDNRNTSTNEAVTRTTVRKKNKTYHQGITDEKTKTTEDGTQNTKEQPNTG